MYFYRRPLRMIIHAGIADIEGQLHGASLPSLAPQCTAPEKCALFDIDVTDTVAQPLAQRPTEGVGNILAADNRVGVLQSHHKVHFQADLIFYQGYIQSEQHLRSALHPLGGNQVAGQTQ